MFKMVQQCCYQQCKLVHKNIKHILNVFLGQGNSSEITKTIYTFYTPNNVKTMCEQF